MLNFKCLVIRLPGHKMRISGNLKELDLEILLKNIFIESIFTTDSNASMPSYAFHCYSLARPFA